MSLTSEAEARRKAADGRRDELAHAYASVAASTPGRLVLADIMQDLAGGEVIERSWPAYQAGGAAHDAVAEVARARAAARIDRLIRAGREG